MVDRYFRFLSFLVLIALAGCANLPFGLGGRARVSPTSSTGTVSPPTSLTPAVEQTATPLTPEETDASTLPPSGMVVRIWLPAQFDPKGAEPASSLLKSRLAEFENTYPDIRLEVRVKALEGSGGLLESLVAANVAAPLALPDLVLLPRPLLESATLKGVLYPYDGLTSVLDDQDWFEYARQLAHVQASIYGIPFAGDALILAYQPSLLDAPPPNLEASLTLGEVLLYPATDPQALFTLCMYLAAGGSLQDAQGRPALDKATLIKVLEYDQRASLAGVMPYWLTQYSNDSQVWDAFLSNPYPMAVTWASSYLGHENATPNSLNATHIPTSNLSPFTLATGWSWALTTQAPERRSLAIKLAEYLIDPEFMAEWTYAAGYLPLRADAMQRWPNSELRTKIAQISVSASLMPPVEMLASLGPALEQAVVDVLKAQSDPQSAAQAVINKINQP